MILMTSDSYLTNKRPVNFAISNGHFNMVAAGHPGTYSNTADILSYPGCYSLIIDLRRKKTVRVGQLGEAVFPAGTYVYTGSAMKGLRTRLKRHCSQKKKIHWHIDYLLTLPEARIKKIILYPAALGQECRQNKRIAAEPDAAVIFKNFGASDCKSGCVTHLLYFAKSWRAIFQDSAPP
jgi:Uri superfamily endonuclease